MNVESRSSARRRVGVSASELAQLGVCEQLVQLEHLCGRRRSRQQLADMARGDEAHRRFFHEGELERPGRCFIATLGYGEGSEVAALRSFRDRVLRATPFGRAVILAYYRSAPAVCRRLAGRPWIIRLVRLALRPVIWGATLLTPSGGGRRDA